MTVRAAGSKRLLKKLARRGLAAVSGALGIGRDGNHVPGIRILTYHRVALDPQDPFAVPPADFQRQMETLATTGKVVRLEEGLAKLRRGDGMAEGVALTFDDGTIDFWTEVRPVIQRLRLPVTLYVNPERLGQPGFLDWPDLRALAEGGVIVGSHGLDHRSLGAVQVEEAWRQVSESRRILEEQIRRPITSFAYPFGTLRDFTPATKECLRRAGYQSACTSINGVNRRGEDLLELRRTKIEQDDTPIFLGILSGRIDGWAFIDRHLSLLQNRYA